MIGLDTNVLVRYLMQDDARQAAAATRLLESLTPSSPAFVSTVSLVELCWVLEFAYGLAREQVLEALEALLRTQELVVENAASVWQAVRLFAATNADFADCLIARVAVVAGCESVVTFDRAAVRSGAMTLVSTAG
jgi:predicted nucleic-acid-binding protein